VSAAVLLLLVATACGDGEADVPSGLVGATPEVHVYDAAVVAASPHEADVSFRAHNGGPQTDRLLAATCACDAQVRIDGALTIDPEEEVVVEAGGVPGVRLVGLTERPRVGRFVTITFTFELAGEVAAEAEVRDA
jgi:copper(I)-binding protein